MYKVRYLPLAEDDVLDAVTYLADKLGNPNAAAALLNELDKKAQRIARFPYAGDLYRTTRPVRDEVRMMSVKSYVLYYTVTEDTVEVRRLLHGRQDRRDIDY